MTGQSPILVTGATSGLGREIALQLAARGERVIASGRRTDRLAELAAQENIQPLKLDLSAAAEIRQQSLYDQFRLIPARRIKT